MPVPTLESYAIFDENPESPSCHAATLVETRQGLLVAWFAGAHEGHSDVAIWSARLDAGAWSRPARLVDVPDVPLWNPVLFREAGGELWLCFKIGPTIPAWSGAWMRSRDDGVTWSEPCLLPAGLLGPAKNKPIQLQSGAILSPTSAETWNSWAVWVELSQDGGRTWRRAGPVTAPGDWLSPGDRLSLNDSPSLNDSLPLSAILNTAPIHPPATQNFPGLIQPALWEYAPGRLRMLMRATRRVGCVCLTESLDGGLSWSPARRLDVPNPNSGLDAVRLADGRIAMVCNPVAAGRTPLSVLLSADNGETFTQRVDLESQPGEYSYPSLLQSQDGAMHIVATYQRRRIQYYRLVV